MNLMVKNFPHITRILNLRYILKGLYLGKIKLKILEIWVEIIKL